MRDWACFAYICWIHAQPWHGGSVASHCLFFWVPYYGRTTAVVDLRARNYFFIYLKVFVSFKVLSIVRSIFENGTWLCHIKINIQERGAAEHLEWLRGAKDARHASARQVHALDQSSGPTGPGSTVS